ncbi:MAG: TRAP transporter substrate-binding protein [Spirochaetales bacterium]|jgi:tripartite ATP-independent transporter DctP family solute receptor|nr:TRAP transporter substrate-binding protein [Spirochaetales bacterium]
MALALAGGGGEDISAGAAAPPPVVLRLADNQPEGYPTVLGDREFARLAEERSGGRLRIQVYPHEQLGDEKSVIEQVQFGGIDFTRVSISPLASFNPLLNALQMPYLYTDAQHMWKVLNGEIGEYFLDSMERKGFIGLGYYDSGARSFYTSKKPIRSAADLRGMKIRVQESPLMMGLVSALGAVPTPMAYGDVYRALQTNAIDGAENNWPSYESSRHYEVAGYFSINEHTRVPEMLIASKISMDKFSARDQFLIKQAAKDSQPLQIQAWADYEKQSETKVREAGCVITQIRNKTEFAQAVHSLYASHLDAEGRLWTEKIAAVK